MEYTNIFKILGRVSKYSVLLVNLDAKIIEYNSVSINLIDNVTNKVGTELFLKSDDLDAFKKYLKMASKSLNLINGGTLINGEKYTLECARFMPEIKSDTLMILYISQKTSVISKFQELNGIYKLSYNVLENKALEKKLVAQAEEIKNAEHEISKLLKVDDITKLATKDHFIETLRELVRVAGLLKNKLAIIFCDIDDFKKVNERYGRYFGDKLLSYIANKIRQAVPENSIISRFNADQFAIILRDNTHVANFEKYLKLLEEIFVEKISIDGTELYNTASFGVVFFPEEGNTAEALITNAELAKDTAKSMIGISRCYFSQEIKANYSRFNKIEIGLRKAIENDGLYLVYQPQYNFKENKITGVEVLCRWNDKLLGNVSPAEFILVAEQSILIKDLTTYVFTLALTKYKDFLERNPLFRDIKLSLNVSAIYLNDKIAFEELINLANNSGIDSKNICFEITETALMENTKISVDLLNTSKKVGYSHAIDDFGVGQSSLSYLKSLPVNLIKIDGSFVRNIEENEDDFTIVKAIINLASTLGFETIAECVETKDQLNLLKEAGCDNIQGYYTGKPMLMDDLEDFILNQVSY